MADPDSTDTKWKARYVASEMWFDDLIAILLRSPWSLALFIGWTVAAVFFGFWVAR